MNIRKPKTALKFKKPAGWWGAMYREALPAGNGLIGAAVYGGAGNDTVMLTHGDLWWQGSVNVLPDVADKLREVRKSLDENKPRAAESVLSNALIAKGYRPQLAYPLPLADLQISMPAEKPVKEYMRVINMENGEVSVAYRDGSTRFERSLFVSRANDTVIMEITKSGTKAIDAEFALDAHDKTCNRTPAGISKTPESVVSKYESFFMYYAARSDNGTDFGAVARVSHYGGSMEVRPDSIRIKGAEKILLLVKPFIESSREKEWKNLKAELAGVKLTYDKLLKEHSALHGRLFGSADIDLEADNRDAFIEDLIEDASANGVGAALIEKLWAFGRYMTVCSTTAESRPIAPYGLWCGDYKAVSSSIRYGSIQMLYSHIFAGNLSEFALAVFHSLEVNLDDLKKNSARLFGTRGIMVPYLMAPGSGLIGTVDPEVLHFTGAAAMIAQMFYDYYLFTDDMKFLKTRALPFMQAAALFYEEFLKLSEDGKTYESSPSYSPGNTPSNFIEGVSGAKMDICKNASVDFSLAKELLANLIRGSELACANKGEIEKWKDMLTRMPAYQINADGAAKEYLHPRYTDNYACRNMSHLYPLFPGNEFKDGDADMLKAFGTAARKRAQGGLKLMKSQSYARLMNTFIRLSDADSAMDMLNNIVRCCVMDNLVTAENDWRGMGVGCDDAWAPYNIEANLAVTGAVQEMLVQSNPNLIKILPALPESMRKGRAENVQTRTGAEATLEWDKKRGYITLKLKSRRTNMIDIMLPQGCKKYKGPGAERYNPETLTIKNLELPSGKNVLLDIKWG